MPGPSGPWHRVRADLAEHATAVVYARPEDWHPDRFPAPRLRALLGRDRERYLALGHPAVRVRFAASRLLLKYTAAAALGARPEDVESAQLPTGRPYLRGCGALDVSLSHTDGLLLVGLTTRGRIGVDVERSDRRLDRSALLRHLCTPYELGAVDRLPPAGREPALVGLWTLKEAYTKALGQGLRFDFTCFGFDPAGPPDAVRCPDGSPAAGDEWSFARFAPADGYTAAVAVCDTGLGAAGAPPAPFTLDPVLVDAVTTALDGEPSGAPVPDPAAGSRCGPS
jgi:4'-phosphopantetheinyl transferase